MSDVTTWADGYGIWWASVPLTDNRRRDALKARRAILAELEQRGHVDPRAVKVRRADVTAHGTARYCEDTSFTRSHY